jgi:RimJ/RimL family protein N-acetyltransferase
MAETAAFVRNNLAKANPSFVAADGATIVGWCDIIRNERRAIQHHRGTVGMGIIAAYRGQGIGTRLLQAAIDAAKAAGMSRIELLVRADNEVAKRLYLRLGFVMEGLHRHADCIDGRYYDAHTMAIVIEAGG